MFDYTNPDFDIQEINAFNNTDSFNEISCYLDFAIATTIHKQYPNIDEEREKQYAQELLTNYLNGKQSSFTRKYNIRENINKISIQKIYGILIKAMIEHQAFNENILHRLSPTNYEEECFAYITAETESGHLEQIAPWIVSNKETLIHHYVTTQYRISQEQKDNYEQIAFQNPNSQRALEQLNLELHLSKYRTK